MLASLLIQLMLLDLGWHAINLGPNTPLPSIQVAMSELKHGSSGFPPTFSPKQCSSSGTDENSAIMHSDLASLSPWADRPFRMHRKAYCRLPASAFAWSDLAKFARMLNLRPQPPKRDRPHKEVPSRGDHSGSC